MIPPFRTSYSCQCFISAPSLGGIHAGPAVSMARREELVWEDCFSFEDAERLLIENQKEHRFNALFVPPSPWVVLGEEVSKDEISSLEAVRNLALRLKHRLRDTPLLNILIRIRVSAVRDEGRQTEWPAFKSRLLDAAGEVGLPMEEVPALETGIDEFDGAFLYPSGKLLNLAKTIKQYGNTLKGFGLSMPREERRFDGDLGSRLTGAICELVSRCVTAFSELTSLERLDFLGGTVDKILKAVCEALEAGQLLQLHTLRLDGLESEEGMASLVAALQSPGCSLQELSIDYIGTEMDSLMRALPSSKIEVLKLGTSVKDPNKAYIALGQALHDPTCKLTVLTVGLGGNLPMSFFEGLQKSLTLRSLGLHDLMTLDDQAMLGDCLKDSNLQELKCPGFQHDHLYEGLLASKVITLRMITASYDLAIYDMAKICDMILENPACKLRSLDLRRYRWANHQAILNQKQVLEALDRNYQSCLENLDMDWSSEAMKKKCSDLLKRNSLFRAVASNVPYKDPYVANLFICGQSGAGKTTIKKNISRKIGGCLPLPACFQRHSSTSGIEMHPLTFNKTDKRLLVYDMAGQFEFHAFHHSFLRGIDKSLFLVVVKVEATPGNFNRGDVTRELVYWLRFIASHKSSSNKRKPKVFIALNFFLHGRVSSAAVRTDVLSLTRQNVQDYKAILDIDDDIMEVKATDSRSLQPLKVKLGGSLTTLLAQQLKVPEAAKGMCMELKKKQNTWEGN